MKLKPVQTFMIKYLIEEFLSNVPDYLWEADLKKYLVDDEVLKFQETMQYISKFKYVSTEDAEELLENIDFQNILLKRVEDSSTNEYIDKLHNGKNIILNF